MLRCQAAKSLGERAKPSACLTSVFPLLWNGAVTSSIYKTNDPQKFTNLVKRVHAGPHLHRPSHNRRVASILRWRNGCNFGVPFRGGDGVGIFVDAAARRQKGGRGVYLCVCVWGGGDFIVFVRQLPPWRGRGSRWGRSPGVPLIPTPAGPRPPLTPSHPQ